MISDPTVRNTAFTLLVLAGLLALQGCSQKIDARQAHVEQGLIYKKDASDPFTGTLINVGSTKVAVEYGIQFLPIDGNCTVPVKNGMFDGVAICENSAGKKIAEISYREGHQDGSLKIWSSDGSNLILSMSLQKGLADGAMERFSPQNGKTVSRVSYVQGKQAQDGEEKQWDSSGGNLIVDLAWKDGKKSGYIKTNEREATYKDGFLEGVLKEYKVTKDGSKRYLESEANYVHSKLEGKKTYWDEMGNIIFSQIYRNEIIQSQTKQRWQNGKIVATESAVNVSDGGTDDRDISLQKDGKEHYASEQSNGIFVEFDIDWQRGKALRGSFEERRDNKIIATYNGIANPDSDDLVKDGVEKRWDNAGNLILEVSWSKGVAIKTMDRTDNGNIFDIQRPPLNMGARIGVDKFAKSYL